ncbi:hypothetical protein AIOGIFDO_01473 [Candidatus Methanoperedenaceae archaeon GB37]|nr:hypothetical protein AIOGIFDO_01473 [Candidatus Methanoperedenaceae archaeon GB37]
MRVVDLPINATEDRVVGTLDIEHVIKEGEKRFEPGVLSEAHRGILYVDEVNLLDDHIVDILLDFCCDGRQLSLSVKGSRSRIRRTSSLLER